MTLAIYYTFRDMPFLIGDSMLTTDDASTGTINFPTLRSRKKKLKVNVPALCQKIVKIRENLYFGWAGPLTASIEMINLLIERTENVAVTIDYMTSLIQEIGPAQDSRLQSLIIVTETEDQGENFAVRIGSFTRGILELKHPVLGGMQILGSGTRDFIKFLHKERFYPNTNSHPDAPISVDALHYGLSFMLKAMSTQKEFDHGLDNRWGSALEIVALRNGLEKIDSILYHTYRYKKSNGTVKFISFGDKILTHYHGDDLIVYTESKKGVLQEFVIRPPQKMSDIFDLNSVIKPTSAKLLVITLVDHSNWNKRRTFTFWNETGHPNVGVNLTGTVREAISIDESMLISFHEGMDDPGTY